MNNIEQLKQHREHAEEIVASIWAEFLEGRPKPDRPPKCPQEQSF